MAVRRRRVLFWIGVVIDVGFGLLQLVPLGHDHSNPPVTQDAPWPDDGGGADRRVLRGAPHRRHRRTRRSRPRRPGRGCGGLRRRRRGPAVRRLADRAALDAAKGPLYERGADGPATATLTVADAGGPLTLEGGWCRPEGGYGYDLEGTDDEEP